MKNLRFLNFLVCLVMVTYVFSIGSFGRSVTNDRRVDRADMIGRADRVAQGCGDGWDTSFTTNGVNGHVYAIVSDGAGNIYIGGSFTAVQGVPISGIAKWNGSNWSALAAGVFGTVRSIAISNGNIYVGGSFAQAGDALANNVAKWDGTSWSAMSSGLGAGSHFVSTLTVYNSDVYAGGSFNTADGSPTTGVARWNGTAWTVVGTGGTFTNSLAVKSGLMYAGTSSGLMTWDGTAWATIGGLTGTVSSVAFSATDIWAVGDLRIPGGGVSHVAKWNGTTWTNMGFFSSGFVETVAVVGNDVYVGGQMPQPSNLFNNLAKWDGTTWSGVSGGVTGGSNIVHAISPVGAVIYVGGNFQTAGGGGALNIATLTNGTTWAGFTGTGIDSPASAIAVSGTDVYVGGGFASAGTLPANKIAKWNSVTNTWSALGSGVTDANSSISSIAVAGDKVYAAGTFSNIGGVNANNIAVWNGSAWSPLGVGVNGTVWSMIVRGEDVYVGGAFSTAGGTTANRVAKWNGTAWSGLNSSSLPNTVVSMAFMGNDLYVGIPTTTIANPAYFSKYDGTTWTALGAALGDRGVNSVAVVGSDVYVSGGFTTIGGTPVNRIAKWNGTSWSAVGGGLPSPIGQLGGVKLTVSGNDLIAIGDFTAASGPANRIAKWNGTSWSSFGTGLNAEAYSVTPAGGDIFVGGAFTTAGCNASPYFARFRKTVWNGTTNTDWHTAANWGGTGVPPAGEGVTISANNATITSADVTLSGLIVAGGRTVTIAAGRTLTVNGAVDLTNGSIAGPGNLIVNDLNIANGNAAGLGTISITGNLILNNGSIAGPGAVTVSSCRPGSIAGGGSGSFISVPLTRCVNPAGTYRFPVGSNGVYAPVELSAVSGNANFTIEAKTGGYSLAATGLPANRLQRWWAMTNGGITQADLTFNYTDPEVTGIEGRYRAYSITGGTAQLVPTVLNYSSNKATVSGATSFAAWTLAEGPATFETLKGRITSPSNRGADRVLVSLTDGLGNVRYTVTNNFGYYRFFNVETWKPYTVHLQSKKYTFSAADRSVDFIESNPDVNFVTTNH